MNDIVIEFSTSFNNDGSFKKYHVVSGSVFNECYNETLDSATVLLNHVRKEDRLIDIKPYDYVRVYELNPGGSESNSHIYLIDNYQEVEENITKHIFSYTINLMSETKILEKVQCPNLAITHRVVNGEMGRRTIYELIRQYIELYSPKVKMVDNENNLYGNWNYERILTVPSSDNEQNKNFVSRFNVTSADLALTAPTLRQLLTTLMQQVGCIPTVKNGEIGYLDFQLEPKPFGYLNQEEQFVIDPTIKNTVNKITRSLSSDSYANTLVDMSDNVLDSDNEVVCETLGFRDKENILLKQKENLVLETKFPIYKVNKFYIKNFYGEGLMPIPQTWQGTWSPDPRYFHSSIANDALKINISVQKFSETQSWGTNGRIHLTISGDALQTFGTKIYEFNTSVGTTEGITYAGKEWFYWGWILENITVHLCKNNNNKIEEKVVFNADNPFTNYNSKMYISPALSRQDLYAHTLDAFGFCDFYIDDIDSYDLDWDSGSNQQNSTDAVVWIEGNITPILFRGIDSTHYETTKYTNWLTIENNQEVLDSNVGDSYAVIYRDMSQQTYYYTPSIPIVAFIEYDITDLLVENGQRGLLETNFTLLDNVNKISKTNNKTGLADFVYGTVGYSIGSTKISGFSSVFSEGTGTVFGWIVKEQTYIENIINFIKQFNNDLPKKIYKYIYNYEYVSTGDPYPLTLDISDRYFENPTLYGVNADNFSYCLFDIYYQPLNSFNLSFAKSNKDIDLRIEQFTNGASGLTDFDRLSIHQQETVDRIGNPTLSIMQRTEDFNDVQNFNNGPLYFLDDLNRDGDYNDSDENKKYVVFKRSYTINNFYYDVSYVGSEFSVLKNYFTSIRTKYRAYQYVDYSQAVLRKENETFYVLISEEEPFDGDNRIRMGNWSAGAINDYTWFIDGIVEKARGIKAIYEREVYEDKAYKNDVSLITSDNTLAIIYQDFDNASPGLRLMTDYEEYTGGKLGGIPQQWYLFSDYFQGWPQLIYTFSVALNNNDISNDYSFDYINDKSFEMPYDELLTEDLITTYNKDFIAFMICDDKNVSSIEEATLTTYKDYAEQIQRTVQFIYYTDSKNIRWSEYFIKNNSLVNNNNFESIKWISLGTGFDFEYGQNWFNNQEDIAYSVNNLDGVIEIQNNNGVVSIFVNWENVGSGVEIIKVIGVTSSTAYSYNYYNLIAFKRPETGMTQRFYVTLNDTKSEYVMSKRNGILYRKTNIDHNVLEKTYHVSLPEETYTLSINAQNSSRYNYSVNRIKVLDPRSSITNNLQDGATIYYGDTLEVVMSDYNENAYDIFMHPGSLIFVTRNVVVTLNATAKFFTLNSIVGTGISSIVAQAYREGTWVTLNAPYASIEYGETIKLTFSATTGYRIITANPIELVVEGNVFAMDYAKSYPYIGELIEPTIYSTLPGVTISMLGKYAVKNDSTYYKAITQQMQNVGQLENNIPNADDSSFYYDYTDNYGTTNLPGVVPNRGYWNVVKTRELYNLSNDPLYSTSLEYTDYSATYGNTTYGSKNLPSGVATGQFIAVSKRSAPSSADSSYTLLNLNTYTWNNYTRQWEGNTPSGSNGKAISCDYKTPNYPSNYINIYIDTVLSWSDNANWNNYFSVQTSNQIFVAAKDDMGTTYATDSGGQTASLNLSFIISAGAHLNIYSGSSLDSIIDDTATPIYELYQGASGKVLSGSQINAGIVFKLVNHGGGYQSASITRGYVVGTPDYPEVSIPNDMVTYSSGEIYIVANFSGSYRGYDCHQSDWRVLMYPATQQHFLYYWSGSQWVRSTNIESYSGLYANVRNTSRWCEWNYTANPKKWDDYTLTYSTSHIIVGYNNGWDFNNPLSQSTYIYYPYTITEPSSSDHYYIWSNGSWSSYSYSYSWKFYTKTASDWSSGNTNTTYWYNCAANSSFYKWSGSSWTQVQDSDFTYYWYMYHEEDTGSNNWSWVRKNQPSIYDTYLFYDNGLPRYYQWSANWVDVTTLVWEVKGDPEFKCWSYTTDTWYYENNQLIKV